MRSALQRIQIRDHAIAELDCVTDILLLVRVHPRFRYRIVRVGRVDGKSRHKDTVLHPADEKFRFRRNTVETSDIAAVVCDSGESHSQNGCDIVF